MQSLVNIFDYTDYREFLLANFRARQGRRREYSIRQFSQALGLRPTALSDVLGRRYGISAKTALGISSALELSAEQSAYLICLVEIEHSRSASLKNDARRRLKRILAKSQNYSQLNEASLSLLESWRFPAILEMISILGATATSAAIAQSLGLKRAVVEKDLKRLLEIGAIEAEGPAWIRRTSYAIGESPVPQATIRSFHKQILTKATDAIESQKISERKFLSSVFSFDVAKIEEARAELELLHRQFISKYEAKENPDSVYAVSLQLFRLDQPACSN